MNKQDKKKLTKHIELNQHMTEISMFGRTAVVDVVPSDRLIDLIDELASPVKVPEFVVVWYEEHKADLEQALYEITIEMPVKGANNDFEKWFIDGTTNSYEILTRMKYGYEVEEEPKYRVNIGGLYLKEPLADTNDFTISMTWNKDYAYPFDSWNMAREHTSELGGTVEKV